MTNPTQGAELSPHSHNARVDLVTVVVGAGPAGLLFAIVARLMHEKHGGSTTWPILVVDNAATTNGRIDFASRRSAISHSERSSPTRVSMHSSRSWRPSDSNR